MENENFGATQGLFADIKIWGPISALFAMGVLVVGFGQSMLVIRYLLPPDYFVGMVIIFVANMLFSIYLFLPSWSNPGNTNIMLILKSVRWFRLCKHYKSLDYNEFNDETGLIGRDRNV